MSGASDVKYKITFPSVDSDDDNFTFLPEDELNLKKRPVVILLGWAGCTARHLAKYSVIYDQQRY